MAGLQRSTETFRRSGSSGMVWEDRNLPGEMNTSKQAKEEEVDNRGGLRPSQSVGTVGMMSLSRSTVNGRGGAAATAGHKGYRTDPLAPAQDPPSPKISCCGFCGSEFSKNSPGQKAKTRRR